MHGPSAHAWQWLYPPLQNHAHGWLEVGDGHAVYWEECGNPLGRPALFLHGGPGAGCTADDRRWFDPQRWRIVLFDQRGAGRSRPLGRLIDNTTEHLLRDIEALRQHLHIERWLLFGGSWGTTLALAYAQRHAQRVAALVLRGVFTATAPEMRGLYTERRVELLDGFAARLHGGDSATEQAAAIAWLRREQELMDREVPPAGEPVPLHVSPRDADAALAMARIGVHFARRNFFLRPSQLLLDANRLHGVPGVMVHGERDLVTPPAAARALHQAWPASRLCLLAAAGHASSDPAMAEQLITATDFFSRPATEPLGSASLPRALAVVKSSPPALLDVVCQPR